MLGRQGEGLVEGVRVEGLAASHDSRESLEGGSDDVHLGLLRRQRDAGGLRMEAHQPGARVLGPVTVAKLARPDPAGGAVLRDLLEEVDVGVEEEGEARSEVVHVEAALHRRLHVGEPVGEREGELLGGGRAGLADVVAGDGDRVPLRHLTGTELDHVDAEAHRRLGREDPLLLRDVLLEDVRLDRPAETIVRDALLVGDADVEAEEHRGRPVDGHRGGDLVERDAVEEELHVFERIDGDALATDLA